MYIYTYASTPKLIRENLPTINAIGVYNLCNLELYTMENNKLY